MGDPMQAAAQLTRAHRGEALGSNPKKPVDADWAALRQCMKACASAEQRDVVYQQYCLSCAKHSGMKSEDAYYSVGTLEALGHVQRLVREEGERLHDPQRAPHPNDAKGGMRHKELLAAHEETKSTLEQFRKGGGGAISAMAVLAQSATSRAVHTSSQQTKRVGMVSCLLCMLVVGLPALAIYAAIELRTDMPPLAGANNASNATVAPTAAPAAEPWEFDPLRLLQQLLMLPVILLMLFMSFFGVAVKNLFMVLCVFLSIALLPITVTLLPLNDGADFDVSMFLGVSAALFSGGSVATLAGQNLGYGYAVQGFAIGTGLSVLVLVLLRGTLHTHLPELETWAGWTWLQLGLSTAIGVQFGQIADNYRNVFTISSSSFVGVMGVVELVAVTYDIKALQTVSVTGMFSGGTGAGGSCFACLLASGCVLLLLVCCAVFQFLFSVQNYDLAPDNLFQSILHRSRSAFYLLLAGDLFLELGWDGLDRSAIEAQMRKLRNVVLLLALHANNVLFGLQGLAMVAIATSGYFRGLFAVAPYCMAVGGVTTVLEVFMYCMALLVSVLGLLAAYCVSGARRFKIIDVTLPFKLPLLPRNINIKMGDLGAKLELAYFVLAGALSFIALLVGGMSSLLGDSCELMVRKNWPTLRPLMEPDFASLEAVILDMRASLALSVSSAVTMVTFCLTALWASTMNNGGMAVLLERLGILSRFAVLGCGINSVFAGALLAVRLPPAAHVGLLSALLGLCTVVFAFYDTLYNTCRRLPHETRGRLECGKMVIVLLTCAGLGPATAYLRGLDGMITTARDMHPHFFF